MPPIHDRSEHIPMMFRAQIRDRAQLHFIPKRKDPDILPWTEEWIEGIRPEAPAFDDTVTTHSYRIAWRLVTNSGQDEDLIRPVMGAGGWPFIPGSTMKGAFRRVCPESTRDLYCGKAVKKRQDEEADFHPGILRFHGGYPTSREWRNHLVDVVHPQQKRQVKQQGTSSALAQISLYRTEIIFGFSSTVDLADSEWEKIWQIWEAALFAGIGCRVSSGYGCFDGLATATTEATALKQQKVLHNVSLKGQGLAPKLVQNSTPEFRPNLIKAALRGHALRLFGGMVAGNVTAERLVQTLFGGILGKGEQGLLSLDFKLLNDEDDWLRPVDIYGSPVTFYDVECELRWQLTKTTKHEAELQTLIQQLTQFAVVLAGFGNSWRRADHRIFMPQYKRRPIGCHWQWLHEGDNTVNALTDVTRVINETRQAVQAWKDLHPDLVGDDRPGKHSTDQWREVWRPERVQVWGRIAKGTKDSKVIPWLHNGRDAKSNQRSRFNDSRSRSHRPQSKRMSKAWQRPGDMEPANIYKTSVSGYVGKEIAPKRRETKVGRIWHRMYPLTGEKAGKYIELLTFFPNPDETDRAASEFQTYLNNQQELRRLWGN